MKPLPNEYDVLALADALDELATSFDEAAFDLADKFGLKSNVLHEYDGIVVVLSRMVGSRMFSCRGDSAFTRRDAMVHALKRLASLCADLATWEVAIDVS